MSHVSSSRRLAQVVCAIGWCLVAAGPVFGFAALKPILLNEGIYREKCKVEPASLLCVAQDLKLNLLFTVACMVTNIAALPVGLMLDTFGPRVTGLVGSAILFLGALAFSQAARLPVDGYLLGYSMLALGGPFVFISCFQLANSFPRNLGLVLALLTGAFDSSLALFLGYRVVYQRHGGPATLLFFSYYLAVPLFIAACQLTIMPSELYKTVGTLAKIASTAIDESGLPLDRSKVHPEDLAVETAHEQPNMAETTHEVLRRMSFVSRRESVVSRASTKSVYEVAAEEGLYERLGGVFGLMHDLSVVEQLRTPWFALMTVFTTIQMLRINYFVATVRAQELYLYQSEETATAINHFFDVALPLGGVCAIPFIGLILDNFSMLTVLVILSATLTLVGVLGLFAWLPATYLGIVLLVVYRPFYYTAVSDICVKVFGFNTFGTIYGTIICILGMCNVLQQVLDRITQQMLGNNPTPVNSVLTLLTVGFALAIIQYVHSQQLHLKRHSLQLEAEEASLSNIPS